MTPGLLHFLAQLGPLGEFKPYATHNVDGDSIEVYLEGVACHWTQPFPYVSLAWAEDDGRLVGVEIHGVKRIIADGSIELRDPGVTEET